VCVSEQFYRAQGATLRDKGGCSERAARSAAASAARKAADDLERKHGRRAAAAAIADHPEQQQNGGAQSAGERGPCRRHPHQDHHPQQPQLPGAQRRRQQPARAVRRAAHPGGRVQHGRSAREDRQCQRHVLQRPQASVQGAAAQARGHADQGRALPAQQEHHEATGQAVAHARQTQARSAPRFSQIGQEDQGHLPEGRQGRRALQPRRQEKVQIYINVGVYAVESLLMIWEILIY
jgi:hypothetical protein